MNDQILDLITAQIPKKKIDEPKKCVLRVIGKNRDALTEVSSETVSEIIRKIPKIIENNNDKIKFYVKHRVPPNFQFKIENLTSRSYETKSIYFYSSKFDEQQLFEILENLTHKFVKSCKINERIYFANLPKKCTHMFSIRNIPARKQKGKSFKLPGYTSEEIVESVWKMFLKKWGHKLK